MSVRLGNGNWAVSASKLLAYNDAAGPFFNKEFDFTRATTATRINKSGLIELVDNNIARIDFTGSSDGHLLLEPESTNLDVNSADLSTGFSTSTGATATVETGLTPFGVSGNIKRLSGATNSPPSWDDNANALKKQFTVTATDPASFFTFSVYVKSAGSSTINIQLRDNTAGPAVTTGAISLTSDWQRVTISKEFTTSTTKVGVVIAGTDGDILLSGAQFEAKEFATSLIPTNGSTVTRNNDVCLDSGISQDFNSLEGVLYCEIAALVDGDTNRNIAISDGTTDNTVEIFYQSGTNTIKWRLKANTNNDVQATVNDTDRTEFNKIAFKYKSGDSTMWLNGVKRSTDTDTFNLSGSLSELSFSNGTTGNAFEGKVREVRVYTKALTDAELTTLTT